MEKQKAYLATLMRELQKPEAWEAVQNDIRPKFEAGERHHLLDMIYFSFALNKPIPEWAKTAFIEAYERVRQYEVSTLDEAFHQPLKKGEHLSRKRESNKRSQIFDRVNEIRETEGAAVDESLFARVGREFNIGKTKCAGLYYEFESIDKKLRGENFGFREITKTGGNT